MTNIRTCNTRDCIVDSYFEIEEAAIFALNSMSLFLRAFHIVIHSPLFEYLHNRLEDRAPIDLGSGKWREKKYNAHKI